MQCITPATSISKGERISTPSQKNISKELRSFSGYTPLLLNSLAMKKFPSPETVSKESRSRGVFIMITPSLLNSLAVNKFLSHGAQGVLSSCKSTQIGR